MSESSSTPNNFHKALLRTGTPEEQIKFDQGYHNDATLRQAANDALLYEQQGGNLIKDTMKGDWINPLLPLFVLLTMVWWVLLVQNLNSGPGGNLFVMQPEYTIPSAPPQNNHNADGITFGALPTDDLPKTPERQGDFAPNCLDRNSINDREIIEENPQGDIVNTQKTNNDAIADYTECHTSKIPILNNVYESVYNRANNNTLGYLTLYSGTTNRFCALNRNNTKLPPGRSCRSVLFISDDILISNKTISPPPIDSIIEKPVNENPTPDPDVIRLLLSSFR